MKAFSSFLLFLSLLFFCTCKKTNEPVNTDPNVLSIDSFSPHAVQVGGIVTITGKGFSTTLTQNEVIVNGTSQKVISAIENQLEVEIQPGTTGGFISVRVNGIIATASGILTILPSNPSLQIISFSPDSVHIG